MTPKVGIFHSDRTVQMPIPMTMKDTGIRAIVREYSGSSK
jgi:hypothetical protein